LCDWSLRMLWGHSVGKLLGQVIHSLTPATF
jgi:hypothetical protein